MRAARELAERAKRDVESVGLPALHDDLEREVHEDAGALLDVLNRRELARIVAVRVVAAAGAGASVAEESTVAATATATATAAAAERDSLCADVLRLLDRLREVETEERAVEEASARLMRDNAEAWAALRAEAETQHEEERELLATTPRRALLRERTALRSLLSALVVESGVDWAADAVLRSVVTGKPLPSQQRRRE